MQPDHLIERIAPGARVTACAPLTGGVSAEVHAVTFLNPDGSQHRVVVRRHRAVAGKTDHGLRARREFELLTVLHARGLPVPRQRLFDPPDRLVQDLVDGATGLPADAAPALARVLADIHATETTGLPDLPERSDPWPELAGWLPAHAARAHGTPAFHGPPRLLHGDFWPGNVLWHAGRIAAVLDWEDAALGDPLSDVACARVELTCIGGEAVARQFTEEYLRKTGIDTARLPAWDLYVSTAALMYMDHWGLEPEALANRKSATTAWQARALRAL